MVTRRPESSVDRPIATRHGYVHRSCNVSLSPLAVVLGCIAFSASAQEGPGLSVVPSIGLRETLTSNVRLDSDNSRSELVTEISPGVRLSSNAGRLKGTIDYSLRGVLYARATSSNEVQQSLSAQGTVEAIDNWAYVDANASISQQSRSAFGVRSPDSALIDPNRTEVVSYQVSPYVRGRLGGFANYVARWAWQSTGSQGSGPDSSSQTTSLRVNSDASIFARMNWSVDYSHQSSEFGSRDSRSSERLNGTLFYSVSPELRLFARAGRESNDLTTQGNEQYSTWGWGGTWRPSQRTSLDVSRDHRFFGNSTNINLQHRMPRSVWTLSSEQDVNASAFSSGSAAVRKLSSTCCSHSLRQLRQIRSSVPPWSMRFLRNNGLTRGDARSGGFLNQTATFNALSGFPWRCSDCAARFCCLFSGISREPRTVHSRTRAICPTATRCVSVDSTSTYLID